MTIRPVVIAPDERLNTKSSPVEVIDDSIRTLAADMLDTMYHERGIGLAAVQVGELKRMLVADVEWRDDGAKGTNVGTQYVLINPEIIEEDPEPHVYKEGCLSFPEQFAEVTRPLKVKVKYQNLEGEWKEELFDGLLATCIQHEIDHINGINFVDHISRLKKGMIIKRLTKMKKQGYFNDDCGHDHAEGETCGGGEKL